MPTLQEILNVCGKPAFVKVASEQPHRDVYSNESKEEVYLEAVTKIANDQAPDWAMVRFWGLTQEVKQASDRWAAAAPGVKELEDSDYCLVADYNGTQIRKYAAVDAETAVRAANAFYDNRARYPYEWRAKTAEALLTKVASFGAILPEGVDRYLKKAACYGIPSQDALEEAIVSRFAAHRPGEFTKLAAVLNRIAATPEMRRDPEVIKIALAAMDEYDADLPESTRGMVKLAEEAIDQLDDDLIKVAGDVFGDQVTLQNGHTVKVSHISKEALSAVSEELAKMASDELVDVLPTLPRDSADLLCRLV